MFSEPRLKEEQRRTIGATRLVGFTHVDKDVRMVEGRQCANAHELLHPDAHARDAGLIVDMNGAAMLQR